jgi:hypothetical protein
MSEGLGDKVEKIIKKVFPVKNPCKWCKKRKEWLNKHFSKNK